MIAQRDPTKSEQLFQKLYDSIRQGELPHGTRLTTEVELAREHHCSRVTVRAGLRRLEELKLIRRVRGDGTYVDCSGKRFSSRRNIAIVALGVHSEIYSEIDPYFSHLMMGLFHNGNKFDFSANFIVCKPSEKSFLESFERQKIDLADYDGLIFAKQLSAGEIAVLEGKRCNFVTLQAPEEDQEVSCIAIDGNGGVYMAARHLLERGRRSIVFLHGSLRERINREKLDGFFRALDESRLTSPLDRRHYEITPFAEEDSAELVAQLLKEGQHFDALIIHGDWATVGAVNALRAAGLRIPDDVALVMYNDYAIAQKVTKLAITSVRQPIEEQIRNALELLLRRHARPSSSKTIKILQPNLMIRETS